MYGRRQRGGAAGSQDDWKQVVLIALIAALLGLGVQQNVAEGFAKQYIAHNKMPTQVELESYREKMVNQFIDIPESEVKGHQESKPPVVQIFDCGDDGVLQAVIMKMLSDGNCFLHSVIAFRKDCLRQGNACPEFPLDPSVLRHEVVYFMRLNLDHQTMCSGISLREYFNRNYGLCVPLFSRLIVCRSGKHSPESFYVNNVTDFFEIMSQPGTHVDEAFITAFSIMYRLRVQVITQARSELRPLEFTDDPKLEAFVALGVSLKEARELLIKYKDDVSRAMDEVLSRREPKPIVDSSKIRWQIQPYGDLTETKIGLMCSSGHYDLMIPPPSSDCDLLEASGYLPPRINHSTCGAAAVPEQPTHQTSILSTKKMWEAYNKSGGGAASVQHQAPPSFGHAPPQVARSQSWQDKLQLLFQSLVISHLAKHIVSPSGKYQTNDDDVEKKLCFLSSVAFDARFTFESIYAEFLYNAPNITRKDIITHDIVTSFRIDKQMFRCTAVVFNDGNVVAFPELKNLQKGDPKRDEQQRAFYDEINKHFLKKPRDFIDKMLFQRCV